MTEGISNAFENIAKATKYKSDGNEQITDDEIVEYELAKHKGEILSYFDLNNITKPITQDAKERGMRLLSFIASVVYEDNEIDADTNKAAQEITEFLFGKPMILHQLFKEIYQKLEFNDIDRAERSIFFDTGIGVDIHKLYNDYLLYKKTVPEISQHLNLPTSKWTGSFPKIPISQINHHEQNEGIEVLPFDERYTRVITENKLRNIVQDTSNIDDGSQFLEPIMPEESEVYSVEQIENFLNLFGEALLQQYRQRDSREWQCAEMAAIMVLIGKKFGINMYKANTDHHTFVVVKIKNIGREGFTEYRIDPTANQYSKQFIGFAITPRIRDIGENYGELKTPIYGKKYSKGQQFQGEYLSETVSDFSMGESFCRVSSEDINNILKHVNNHLKQDKAK